MPVRESKLICGKKHYKVLCGYCKERVWTQSLAADGIYVCYTCVDPKFGGQTLGLSPGYKPVMSEKRYNG